MQNTQSSFESLNKMRTVLIVEDEQINREILTMMLQEDYQILCAETAREALSIVEEKYETLSMVLLDLNLPDVSGLDVLRKIKASPLYAKLPVIVMTADSEAEVECLSLGAIDFIPKPYPQPNVVLARILRTIQLSENQDTIRFTERDQLTGLYNKEFFFRYAVQLDLYHKDTPMDAIVLDINHFHTVNARYGKAFGDKILNQIAQKVQEAFSDQTAILGRSGADHFLIYCPHLTEYEHILEKIVVLLDDNQNSENRVHLRMGIYSNVDKELDIERRFDRAKMAADHNKGSFTKRINMYDQSMYETEMLHEQLIGDFQTALREKQFVVYYQPKYDVRSNEPVLCSAEALVRWNHPKMGMVSPGVFIPLFENNGLIQQLDQYVWSEASAQIRRWKQKIGFSVPVSVNVSRIDLYDPDLAKKLQEICDKNELDYRELLLEITESAYTENSDQIVEKVKTLRALGFKIEMDDFGSGYSSLNMLSTLPIDALKLDMQFIRNAFKDRKDTRLLEAMIQLADSFEVLTIAEGVETAEQTFTLKMMGCDIIQGYFFSKPVPANEFEAFLKESTIQATGSSEKAKQPKRDKFSYDALHDPLTGLYNNTAFDVLFHDSDHDHIAVLLATVADYNAFLKAHGKAYAEQIILRVARVLRKHFRSVDHICRLREDEFVIIMTRMTSEDKTILLNRISGVFSALMQREDTLDPIVMNFGIAFSDRENPSGNVFHDAEIAIKRLKPKHESSYEVY